ncbi:MAG: hypothetical protein WD607_06200 [Candidatus Paceibacterota bacterium]
MFITFETKEIRSICENFEKAKKELDEISANNLKTRLSELIAAENLKDEVINLYLEKDANGKEYVLPIGNFCLKLIPINVNSTKTDSSNQKSDKITRLKILSINRKDS